MKTAHYIDVLLLGLAATCAHAQNTATTEPCAQVAEVFDAATSKPIRVDPDIALACLQSVPLHVTEGMMQLEGLKSLMEFQSNLAYLKDPPPGWYYPAVDMLGEIDSMASRLQENRYASEYDFQLDIYKLVASARDAHLVYTPDIINVFSFQRAGSIISVSNDGLDVPSLYLYREVVAVVKNGSTMATSIVSINGENAEQWLERYAEVNGQYHDPDVDYNAVFPNSVTNGYGAASGGGASAGVFTGSSFHQGNATTLTFENGTTIEVPTYAVVQANFTGVTDGASFYDKFCTGPQESSTGSSAPSDASESATPTYTQAPFSAVPTQANLPTISGFPDALVMASDYSVAGYLTADGFAVLSIPSFNVDDDAVPDFQSTVRKLLATAQAQGSTHLIIDVRGNGGGSTFLAFDVFKQIFPKQTPTATLNSRAHPLFNDLGTIFSSHFQNTTTADPPQSTVDIESPLNVANNLKDQTTRYPTWSSLYGPIKTHNDTFTNLMQYNLTNPPLASYSITSYGPLSNITTQPVFSPSQILLLSDGVCGSACALFSELMKSQAPEPIKSLVFGGRSQPGPMQAVGNTKGAEVRPFNRLRFYFDDAISELGTSEQSQALLAKYPNFNASTEQVLLRAASPSSGNPQLNLRNNVRVGDDEERTPLQFIYEAADCRLFYTAEQIFNQSAVWAAAKEAIWGGGDCVEGSKGERSAGLLVGKEVLVPFGGGEAKAKEQGSDGASVSTGAADGLLYNGRGMMVGVATAVGAALMLL